MALSKRQLRAIHTKSNSGNIGFDGLTNKVARYYISKGISRKKAFEIGRKTAGIMNARYVRNYPSKR